MKRGLLINEIDETSVCVCVWWELKKFLYEWENYFINAKTDLRLKNQL